MGAEVRKKNAGICKAHGRQLSSAASLVLLLAGLNVAAVGQSANNPALTSLPIKTWVEQACEREAGIIDHTGSLIRYQQHTIDARRNEVREVIESKDGTVARLLMRDNRPLTADEDQAERDRLQGLIDHPSEFQKHVTKDTNGKKQAIALIKLMPDAMIYTYAADQTPSRPDAGPQVVIDYVPNPKFNPPTTESQALSGLKGRVWIDARSKTVVRINAEVFQAVNFGWGILAHIYPGGKLDVEQAAAQGNRWNMTDFHERVVVKALMVKTINVNTEVHSMDFQVLPQSLGYQDAVRELLKEPLPK